MKRTKPPFRADHNGSLLRTAPLKKAREKFAENAISAGELKDVEDSESVQILATPEEVGLQSITDGEVRRSGWHLDY
ncbi:MAG: 5-methyltetrahydropteroyltriglutamate--homocysteine S-methyltransferase, partial [Hyphomicrobiales bacterium]|nr:5-methyltetrahydropteroyltriglutamate--homocysteine S-methyltransferase [Hyphomicrobiales bacterium]